MRPPAVERPTFSTRVGPVRLPDPALRVESAAASLALYQLRRLHEFCAAPGRPLTRKGNLRLDDARHLVDVLGTGDTPDVQIGSHRRTLRSAEDLPVLSWLVQLALDARVVRRHRGRVVAVAGWTDLPAVEAVDRLVDAAVDRGLSGFLSPHLTSMARVRDFVDQGARQLLGELLGSHADGEPMSIDKMAERVVAHVTWNRRLNVSGRGLVAGWVRDHFDRLAALGIVTVRDVQRTTTEWGGTEATGGSAELTPAGVPVAARLAEEAAITVIIR
ncbi:MAG: hypothetical protein ACRDT0_20155 [Pseudonocardiaceae bacterium]